MVACTHDAHHPIPSGVNVVRIDDLPGARPRSDIPTTAMLGRRSKPGSTTAQGMTVITVCGETYCTDGLRDERSGSLLVDPAPTPDEREVERQGGWLERVLRVVYVSEDFVSLYVAESSLSAGAAHANNRLSCTTYDRHTGHALPLDARLQPDVDQALRSEPLYLTTLRGSLVKSDELVVCAEGTDPIASGTIAEVHFRR